MFICMIKIPLTQRQYALIDNDDLDLVSKYNWFAAWSKHTQSFVAIANIGGRKNHGTIYMHRLIMNTPKGSVDCFGVLVRNNTAMVASAMRKKVSRLGG